MLVVAAEGTVKPGGIVREVAGFLVGKLLEALFGAGRPKGPTAAELHDELHVGGPTADQMKRAREEADEKWPAPAPVPRELAGNPPREDMP